MKKPRTKIYIKISPEESKIVYSGIEFSEFIEFLPKPIENILLIEGDYWGNKQAHNFELLEGREIENLAKEDVYSFGNFSFVDYAHTAAVNGLSNQQVAELLYLAHAARPLSSPFFAPLENRFAYLAHDDGWYCKLYCRDLRDFTPVLLGKIMARAGIVAGICSDVISDKLISLAKTGMLIDLEEMVCAEGTITVELYTVGEYSNMDDVLNNFERLKANAAQISSLRFAGNEYIVLDK